MNYRLSVIASLLTSMYSSLAFAQQPALDSAVIARDAEEQATHSPKAAEPLRFEVRDIRVEGASLLPEKEIRALVEPYLGKSLGLDGLRTVAEQITARYRAAGYPLVVVLVPPQRIENGVAVLSVFEGKLGKVSLKNASRLSDETVRTYLLQDTSESGVFRENERGLMLVGDLAGSGGADYRLQPASDGSTDITVTVDYAPRLNGSVLVDNYGSKSTGRIRSRANLHLNSPFGRGERFSLQAMSSFKGVSHGRLAADVPLGSNGTVLLAGVGRTHYELGNAFKDLDASGRSDSIDITVRHPLKRNRKGGVWLSGGSEWRKLRDEIGVTQTKTRKNVTTFNLGLDGSFRDDVLAGGYTRLGINTITGNLQIKDNDARTLDAAAAKTNGRYYKINANLSRTQFLTPKLSISGSLQTQWANKNLDSGEQMSIGGADGVAGYRSNDISADSGLLMQTELRYAVHPSIVLSGFFDAAKVRQQRKPYVAGKNTVSLYGGGIGAELRIKGFSLQSKVAVRGSDVGASDKKRSVWWLRAGYEF